VAERRAVTLVDVAARAGVSRTTASAALNRTGRVSDGTRTHIEQVARAMNYQVNRAARSLRQDRTGAIAIHLPAQTTTSSYYMDITFGIADVLVEHDFSLVLHSGTRQRALLTPDQVDGVIVVDALDGDEVVADLLAGPMPVVTAEGGPRDLPPGRGSVSLDHQHGMRALLDHLMEEQSLRPALISPGTHSDWGRTLTSTFRSWCAEQGIEPVVVEVPFTASPEEATRATTALLQGGHRPDSLVCGPDGSAVGAITAAASLGLRVGVDVLIASCVDGPVMQMSQPQITALDLHARQHGQQCARMLLDLLHSETSPDAVTQTLMSDLVVRESTRRLSF
jgi:DNA-binding LacI/PurR family transcriptional regulator